MEKFVLFLTVFITLVIFFAIYLVVGKMSKHPMWPWHETKEVVTTKSSSGMLRSISTYESSSSKSVLGSIGIVLIVILFIALFIVLVFFSIKLSMKRYEIANQAIKEGNTGLAVSALAPEIGEGIGSVLGKFNV